MSRYFEPLFPGDEPLLPVDDPLLPGACGVPPFDDVPPFDGVPTPECDVSGTHVSAPAFVLAAKPPAP